MVMRRVRDLKIGDYVNIDGRWLRVTSIIKIGQGTLLSLTGHNQPFSLYADDYVQVGV